MEGVGAVATTINGGAHTAPTGDIEEYLALVRTFPLVHIRDDAHLTEALAVFETLFEKREQSDAEKAYLAVLTDLIEAYENATVRIPDVSGARMVRHFMEDRGLRQLDLVPVLGSASIVSEVLSEKRPLALSHIKKLAAYFGVSPAVFID